jgi:hypothetical protein
MRSPAMQKFVDSFAQSVYGRSQTVAVQEHICVTCGKPVSSFRNDKSAREYEISGMCMNCQDEVFGKD